MKLFSICIPNYNRIDCLKQLMDSIIGQLDDDNKDYVEICISDDCSKQDPTDMIKEIIRKYEHISIRYHRNERNMGMDWNFIKSVELSSGEYCCIVGNDDLFKEDSVPDILDRLKRGKEQGIDIISTPFQVLNKEEEFVKFVKPLHNVDGNKIYDFNDKEQYKDYFIHVAHDSGIFAFLSSIIFLRKNLMKYKDRFSDKMGSIFIQIYIHLQTIKEGAKLWYINESFIKNRIEEVDMNHFYKMAIGQYNVVEYFFKDEIREYLMDNVVSIYPFVRLLNSDIEKHKKEEIYGMRLKAMDVVREVYLPKEDIGLLKNKFIVLFGSSSSGIKSYNLLNEYGIEVKAFTDNDRKKWYAKVFGKKIIRPIDLLKIDKEALYVIIASVHYVEIYGQLRGMGIKYIKMIR